MYLKKNFYEIGGGLSDVEFQANFIAKYGITNERYIRLMNYKSTLTVEEYALFGRVLATLLPHVMWRS